MAVLSKRAYNIQYDPAQNWVNMKWEGYISSAEFREGTELMLNLLIKNNANKVLADIEHMLLIDKEDQEWLISYFLPRAIRFGFRAIALLKPISTFNSNVIESISSHINQEISIKVFNNIEKARDWLIETET
ncbi:STAS/SEC14 domain-containing protein [Fulvivirga ulvae]|uniref:STAS/SEC14 domain-containing protein n=1 Tax=Fulvivirga ulvae TaxID=2904245 RepID=UPI001F28397E|nr:STAS/SEC14 domain-containing protein [Fulvivirga ulvae]UII31434.1 STAS/SEC14 domain-containing protein [Fulvivirga ulvae]